MDAKELIRAGRLADARRQLVEEVKASPADSGRRTLLFQVLCFYGEWDKAGRHLDAIAAQDVKAQIGVQVYKNLVHAEKERREVSRLERRPPCLPEPPPYLEMYFAACNMVAEGKIEEAEDLFRKIEDSRPIVSGTINGKTFSGLKDTDTSLAYFLEAIVHDQYVRIPFESIRELSISPPATLFDLLWIPARVTTWEGLTMNCYCPVLYPDSHAQEDDRIKLGRMTDWLPLGGPFSKAVGQHVFEIGDEEIALLDIREAQLKLSDSVGDHENKD